MSFIIGLRNLPTFARHVSMVTVFIDGLGQIAIFITLPLCDNMEHLWVQANCFVDQDLSHYPSYISREAMAYIVELLTRWNNCYGNISSATRYCLTVSIP